MITLTSLDFAKNALEPYIDEATIDIHYGKHHQGYVNKLNELIANTEFENLGLEEIIKTSSGAIFNNAAQIWNHTFYRKSLRPATEGNKASGELYNKICSTRESFENFQNEFSKSAIGNFGSGWTWLVQNTDGSLEILNTSNAQTTLTSDKKPLFTIDVREHAYYLKYQNRRPEYVNNFWNIINRDFASNNLR